MDNEKIINKYTDSIDAQEALFDLCSFLDLEIIKVSDEYGNFARYDFKKVEDTHEPK